MKTNNNRPTIAIEPVVRIKTKSSTISIFLGASLKQELIDAANDLGVTPHRLARTLVLYGLRHTNLKRAKPNEKTGSINE